MSSGPFFGNQLAHRGGGTLLGRYSSSFCSKQFSLEGGGGLFDRRNHTLQGWIHIFESLTRIDRPASTGTPLHRSAPAPLFLQNTSCPPLREWEPQAGHPGLGRRVRSYPQHRHQLQGHHEPAPRPRNSTAYDSGKIRNFEKNPK